MKKSLRLLLVMASIGVVILSYCPLADAATETLDSEVIFDDGSPIKIKGFSESIFMPPERGSVEPKFGPIVLSKEIDLSTPNLHLILLKGTRIRNVTINFYAIDPATREPALYFQIQLQEVQISSIDIKEQAHPLPALEELKLTFAKIRWISLVTGNQAGWNLKTNRPLAPLAD